MLPEQNTPAPPKNAFTSVARRDSPEDLEKEAQRLKAEADAIRSQKQLEEKQQQDSITMMAKSLLDKTRNELQELNEVIELSGKLSLAEVRDLNTQKKKLAGDVTKLESQLGIRQIANPDTEPQKSAANAWPTVAKILALILGCFGIVSYSGEWILDKYPTAAIYNDVSFQKVLFAFSVFIFGIGSAIIALTVFFPGIGKYFNPFNRQQLDFFSDFKTLSQWQRTVISVALFFALLLAFVLTVSGKLD